MTIDTFTREHLQAYILRTMVDPFDSKEIQLNFANQFVWLVTAWLEKMTKDDAQYLIGKGWPYLIEEYNKNALAV